MFIILQPKVIVVNIQLKNVFLLIAQLSNVEV